VNIALKCEKLNNYFKGNNMVLKNYKGVLTDESIIN